MDGKLLAISKQRDVQALVKLSRPRLAGILTRERLLQKLDEARPRPVTWVMGPAGSGKTTLVSSYLEARGLACLWYQVDEGDEDIATFFYYLGLAANLAIPRTEKPLPLFSVQHTRGVHAFARNFFFDLCNGLPQPGLLVFDDYHNVNPDSKLHEVMRAGLEAVPAGCRVFAISRHAPPPALTRLRANGAMAVIGWRDLRLTQPETQGIVALRSRDARCAKLFEPWIERTEGWCRIVARLVAYRRYRARGACQLRIGDHLRLLRHGTSGAGGARDPHFLGAKRYLAQNDRADGGVANGQSARRAYSCRAVPQTFVYYPPHECVQDLSIPSVIARVSADAA